VHFARVQASIPSADLLRNTHPRILLVDTVDRWAAAVQSSYAAALVVDAYRHFPTASAHRQMPLAHADWASGVNSFTLPMELTHAVRATSFFSDIADVKDPLTSLVSKVLNSRCQARKYGTVAEKALMATPEQMARYDNIQQLLRARQQLLSDADATTARARKRKHTATTSDAAASSALTGSAQHQHRFVEEICQIGPRRRTIQRLVLCSLLGNYPHCASRVTGPARNVLYALLEDAPVRASAWFQSLLHQCPELVVWCVRDFMVHTLLDDPALCEQVDSMMRFEQFEALVQTAMSDIRTYVCQNLPYDWSQMRRAADAVLLDEQAARTICACHANQRNQPSARRAHLVKARPASSPRPTCLWADSVWLDDMRRLLHPHHEAMLAISYRKPDVSELTFLLGIEVRQRAPLVPRPLSDEERATQQQKQDAQRQIDEEEADDELFHRLGRVHGKDMLHRIEQLRQQQREQREQDAQDAVITSNAYLTPAQLTGLSFLVDDPSHVVRNLTDLIERLRLLGGFGLSDTSAQAIITLLAHHRNGTATKQDRLRRLQHLQRTDPHAYNLLQVGADLLKERETRRARIVGVLPLEALQSQIRAAERKWGTQGAIEQRSVCLHVCLICNKVHSNVRDPNSQFQRFYRFGLRGAACDYDTGEMYCEGRRVTRRGCCSDQPLAVICLLGLRYSFGKKVYQLCVGCSDVMVPDTTRGACIDDHELGGLLCCACSDERRKSKDARPDSAVLEQLHRRCACCSVPTMSLHTTFVYPHGICVCNKHHTRFMDARVEEAIAAAPEGSVNADFVRGVIQKVYLANKERKRKRAQPAANKRMRRQRQRDRQKRA
jgi:hypothetical protein